MFNRKSFREVLCRCLIALLLGIGLIACSPEGERTLGGGPGADPRNLDSNVEMHRGAEPYHDTPDVKSGYPVAESAK